MALLFARRAGVEPDLERWPDLRRALLSGPLSPVSFRLEGPHSLGDAAARVAAEAAACGYLDPS
jgi:dimethylaniline monooxygenase (N-oxide forming)